MLVDCVGEHGHLKFVRPLAGVAVVWEVERAWVIRW